MDRKEMTAPISPVGARAEQSQSLDKTIIAETAQNCKMPDETFSQMQMEILQMLDPTFLATISMKELYERIFHRKPPIIDGLLNAENRQIDEQIRSAKQPFYDLTGIFT